ncbi:MAG: undecaprenyldiphospho-muramoylpentapeptide beta-N-acetylglucosaminyltransferase, partial [Pseudomonadota bacterium]
MHSHKLLIAAGGTGGHITPALAIAEAFEALGGQVRWIGTQGGLESKMVPKKYRLRQINFNGVVGGSVWAKLKMPFALLRALWQTHAVFRAVKPDMVLGMGGFPALPAGLYAWLTRTPLAIHEQNAVLGLSNRVLAKKADLCLSGFPQVFADVAVAAMHVGNPVRASMDEVNARRDDWYKRQGPLFIVVVGGSRGAKILNEIVPLAMAHIPLSQRPKIVHQTGAHQQAVVSQAYQKLGIEATVLEFIDDMAAIYAQA